MSSIYHQAVTTIRTVVSHTYAAKACKPQICALNMYAPAQTQKPVTHLVMSEVAAALSSALLHVSSLCGGFPSCWVDSPVPVEQHNLARDVWITKAKATHTRSHLHRQSTMLEGFDMRCRRAVLQSSCHSQQRHKPYRAELA